jgi:hypothetical protein
MSAYLNSSVPSENKLHSFWQVQYLTGEHLIRQIDTAFLDSIHCNLQSATYNLQQSIRHIHKMRPGGAKGPASFTSIASITL